MSVFCRCSERQVRWAASQHKTRPASGSFVQIPGPERLVYVPPPDEQIYAVAEAMMLDVANAAVSHRHNTNIGRLRESMAMLEDEMRRKTKEGKGKAKNPRWN